MTKEMKIDLMKDFTEEEVAAITPSVPLHTHEDEIVKMYKADEPVAIIIEQFGISSRTLYEILQAKKVQRRAGNTVKRLAELSDLQKETLLEVYKANEVPVLEIIKRFRITKDVLYTLLDEASVERRYKEHSRNKTKAASFTKDLPTAVAPSTIQVHQLGDELMVTVTKQAQQLFKKITVSYEV